MKAYMDIEDKGENSDAFV